MSGLGRRMVWLMAVLVACVGVLFVGSSAAHADDGGYPYASYNGPGSNPAGSIWRSPNGGLYSPYTYVYRNCTDYAAWKLVSLGVPLDKVKNLGFAKDWAVAAANRGLAVDGSPEVGAVAVKTTGDFGHVAYVEAVNTNGTITISEYNWPVAGGYDGAFHRRTGTPQSLGFDKFIHYDRLMANPPGGTGATSGPLTVTQALALAPANARMYQPLTFTFTVRTYAYAASIKRFTVAVRDQAGGNQDVPCNYGEGVALPANTSWQCVAYLEQGYGSRGPFTFWADWMDYNNTWHAGQLGGMQSFTLAPASILTTTQAISVGPANPVRMYHGVFWSYRVKNTSGGYVSVKRFVAAVRTPGGGAMDVPCQNGDGVALAPGQEWTCAAYNNDGYGSTGPFQFWADWLDYADQWHPGQLSGVLTLTVT